jgi:hypothetical protein
MCYSDCGDRRSLLNVVFCVNNRQSRYLEISYPGNIMFMILSEIFIRCVAVILYIVFLIFLTKYLSGINNKPFEIRKKAEEIFAFASLYKSRIAIILIHIFYISLFIWGFFESGRVGQMLRVLPGAVIAGYSLIAWYRLLTGTGQDDGPLGFYRPGGSILMTKDQAISRGFEIIILTIFVLQIFNVVKIIQLSTSFSDIVTADKEIIQLNVEPLTTETQPKESKNALNSIDLKVESEGSFYEKAKKLLPVFSNELQGNLPIRIRNPNDFSVVVGIRQRNSPKFGGLRWSGGKDLEVPPNSAKTVYVQDGEYDIYFVHSNKPDALFKGDWIQLIMNGIEIHIAKVSGGNYNIRQVK